MLLFAQEKLLLRKAITSVYTAPAEGSRSHFPAVARQPKLRGIGASARSLLALRDELRSQEAERPAARALFTEVDNSSSWVNSKTITIDLK